VTFLGDANVSLATAWKETTLSGPALDVTGVLQVLLDSAERTSNVAMSAASQIWPNERITKGTNQVLFSAFEQPQQVPQDISTPKCFEQLTHIDANRGIVGAVPVNITCKHMASRGPVRPTQVKKYTANQATHEDIPPWDLLPVHGPIELKGTSTTLTRADYLHHGPEPPQDTTGLIGRGVVHTSAGPEQGFLFTSSGAQVSQFGWSAKDTHQSFKDGSFRLGVVKELLLTEPTWRDQMEVKQEEELHREISLALTEKKSHLLAFVQSPEFTACRKRKGLVGCDHKFTHLFK
jgi:hypothetical protein